MDKAVIGVDIGGTKIAAHICNSHYQTLFEKTISCPAQDGAQAILYAVTQVCLELMAAAENIDISAIGIGAAGQIHPHTGVVLYANENLKGWTGTKIAVEIQTKLGIPVYVDNDVRTMALAESTIGAGIGYRDVLCLTVGTGIGGALILNNEIWYGSQFTAGEFGYIQYEPSRTIEQIASGPALERLYAERKGLATPIPLAIIAQQASGDDVIAREILAYGATALGKILAPILLLLSPQAVIIGGGVAEIGQLWWTPLLAAINQFEASSIQKIPVLPAKLGTRAGILGAAILALQKSKVVQNDES